VYEDKIMKEDKEAKKNLSRRDFVKTTAGGIGAAALAGIGAQEAAAAQVPKHWDKVADVVVVGAGAAGFAAAIEAVDNKVSVIIIEQNFDIGGHAIQSSAACPLGGGTTLQKKWGIEDSPDLYFSDLLNFHEMRFSDRELIRAFCDNSAATYEWEVANGVVFPDQPPFYREDFGPESVFRKRTQGPLWTEGVTPSSPTGANGTALMRPLEASARKKGVQILLEHSLTSILRESDFSGRVLGIAATNQGKTVTIQARKGVVIATGGHSSNVNFRRIFDPRLTEEYQVVGEPYSRQPGEAEVAAIRIGASLWGAAGPTVERVRPHYLEKPRVIGTRYGYQTGDADLTKSRVFHLMRATGLKVKDYQNVIHVNQVGRRIVDETATSHAWFNPCLSLNGGKGNGGGPIWAIFDADAARREEWVCAPPQVDPDGFFFSANSLQELAGKIGGKYQKQPMPADILHETVARYNSLVDAGKDADFGKPGPKYKIQTPPFYAGWSVPCVHDCVAGLRINAKSQVIDLMGQVIPGLYCGGESAGGFNLHGLAKSFVQGRIAGREAARSNPNAGNAA
jgi:succinate dehydrogenase/fumarate reductase flavoprotein subunit